jgi:hypothetical protein
MRDDQSDNSEWREYGQGGTSFYLFRHYLLLLVFRELRITLTARPKEHEAG